MDLRPPQQEGIHTWCRQVRPLPMEPRREPTSVTLLTCLTPNCNLHAYPYAHTYKPPHLTKEASLCISQKQLQKATTDQNADDFGCPAPINMSTTQPIHLRLGKYIRRGSRKIVRAKRTRMGCLLRDAIFCIWEGSWTQEISSMWLPKQDLKKWRLTCQRGLLFSILTVLVLSLYKGPRNPSVQTFHCSNNLESTLHVDKC